MGARTTTKQAASGQHRDMVVAVAAVAWKQARVTSSASLKAAAASHGSQAANVCVQYTNGTRCRGPQLFLHEPHAGGSIRQFAGHDSIASGNDGGHRRPMSQANARSFRFRFTCCFASEHVTPARSCIVSSGGRSSPQPTNAAAARGPSRAPPCPCCRARSRRPRCLRPGGCYCCL